MTLLERERFPRDHIGESLLPASMPILDVLGILPRLEAQGYLKKWGATMVWGTTPEPWSWHFRETNTRHPHAYQVWRPDFDQLLLDNAAAAGARVREGCRVLRVLFDGDRAAGVLFTDESGREERLASRHVVDASGQAGLIGRALGLRRVDPHFRNLAVYGYYENAERLPEPNATNIFIESFEHGWFWNIPLHTGWMSVGAVVDARHGQEGIARRGAPAFFAGQIDAAPRTKAMLADARLVQGPAVIRDWSYVSDRVVGPGWILCGDAACFIDPLFSTGVHLALSSGLMAAAYVATVFADAELAAAAGPVYQSLYAQQYSHFRELARLFYASNRTIESYFWEVRRVLRDDALTPREAFVRATAGQSDRGLRARGARARGAAAGFRRCRSRRRAGAGRARAPGAGAAGVAPGRRSRAGACPGRAGGAESRAGRGRLRLGTRSERPPSTGGHRDQSLHPAARRAVRWPADRGRADDRARGRSGGKHRRVASAHGDVDAYARAGPSHPARRRGDRRAPGAPRLSAPATVGSGPERGCATV